MHVNAFLQSTPVVLVGAVCAGLLALLSMMMRSSRARARRVVRHRVDVGSTASHGLGLVVFSPVGSAGLSSITAFFALQLLRPAQDSLGRPIAVHFELLTIGFVLCALWWGLGYVQRVPTWLLPRWARGAQGTLPAIAARLVRQPGEG